MLGSSGRVNLVCVPAVPLSYVIVCVWVGGGSLCAQAACEVYVYVWLGVKMHKYI